VVRRTLLVTSIAMVAAVSTGAAAHPLHTTITEIVHDARRAEATVVVRAFENDVRAALSARQAPHATDAAVLAYVGAKFALRDRAGKEIGVRWENVRRRDELLWIEGRVSAPRGLSGVGVHNDLLTELHSDQVNVVQVVQGERRQTLLFTRGDALKPLR
jgi:hypothetical protein